MSKRSFTSLAGSSQEAGQHFRLYNAVVLDTYIEHYYSVHFNYTSF